MKSLGSATWIEFFLKILLMQAEQAIELFSKEENIEKLLSLKQFLVWQYHQDAP